MFVSYSFDLEYLIAAFSYPPDLSIDIYLLFTLSPATENHTSWNLIYGNAALSMQAMYSRRRSLYL